MILAMTVLETGILYLFPLISLDGKGELCEIVPCDILDNHI